jgi:hypothetical protein
MRKSVKLATTKGKNITQKLKYRTTEVKTFMTLVIDFK